jgi:protein-S-isoprenylcysteine O-methyltransferase Ste14
MRAYQLLIPFPLLLGDYFRVTGQKNPQSGVSGFFQYVRNPMYVAVVSLILGQGLFFGSIRHLEYGTAVCLGFYLFVLIYEEPVLRKSYGREYEEFCANVPRWIPRLRPWRSKRE